jgi:hypothetical protein
MSHTNVLHSDDSLGWRCDSCHRRITRVGDGWVEWLAAEDKRGGNTLSGLRLVHRLAYRRGQGEHPCRYDPHKVFGRHKRVVEGVSLASVVGPDGLMLLLSFLASGEFPRAEVLELAKRVQVPGYETTRILFHEATASKVVTSFLGKGYYLQSEINELLSLANQTPRKPPPGARHQNPRNAVA